MTVTYSAEVATTKIGCFFKLLVRWRGSIYKLLWPDFLIFAFAYTTLSLVYRFALNDDQKRVFEDVSIYCDQFTNLIPIAFVLGFYVNVVVSRWWDQYTAIPWPDRVALLIGTYVQGSDRQGRLVRRTLIRYCNLAFVMVLRCISSQVKKRFPSDQHLLDGGLITETEQKKMNEYNTKSNRYFVPLIWASTLAQRCRVEQRITDDLQLKAIVDEVASFRGQLGLLLAYDWVTVPLVYTQVVTVAVYSFFMSCLMGRQFLDPTRHLEKHEVDIYVPVFTLLQFFFYMGWLKVAESLLNPFGEDDDDFETNWLIDRHVQVGYTIVDEMHMDHPELTKDVFWDKQEVELPYTQAAKAFKKDPFMGSALNVQVKAGTDRFTTTPGTTPLASPAAAQDGQTFAFHARPSTSPTAIATRFISRLGHRRQNRDPNSQNDGSNIRLSIQDRSDVDLGDVAMTSRTVPTTPTTPTVTQSGNDQLPTLTKQISAPAYVKQTSIPSFLREPAIQEAADEDDDETKKIIVKSAAQKLLAARRKKSMEATAAQAAAAKATAVSEQPADAAALNNKNNKPVSIKIDLVDGNSSARSDATATNSSGPSSNSHVGPV